MTGHDEGRGDRSKSTGRAAFPGAAAPGDTTAHPGEVAGVALDRFGTDRLGSATLETDRLLAGDQRARSPEVRLQAGLRADAGRLLANWVVRIANLPVYRARPDLALDQLMDGLPGLVHAVLRAVATTDPGLETDPATHAADVAADLARRRAAAGFSAGAIQAEFCELHLEVLSQVWRLVDETSTAGEATWTPRATIERLAGTIGELSVAAAEALSTAPATAGTGGSAAKG